MLSLICVELGQTLDIFMKNLHNRPIKGERALKGACNEKILFYMDLRGGVMA